MGRALADAPGQAQRDRAAAHSLTHELHTYPARLHPATARRLVSLALDQTAGGVPASELPAILDPFCGSGTVLVEARHAGARALGVDANPLAVLIARAKTWTVPAERREQLRQVGRRMAAAALAEGKAARRAGYEPPPLHAPVGVDPEERDRRLRYWFAPHVRRELEHLATGIDQIRSDDAELADVLNVVLSSILYKVSRRASDTDNSRVERRVARGAAARLFGERVDLLHKGLAQLARSSRAPAGEVRCGDARHLDRAGLADAGVSAIVTSPPYAGIYDYAEQHQLRLDFLGMPTQAFRVAEMGARREFAEDGEALRRAKRRFTRALSASLAEAARVLAPAGVALVVQGDSVAHDRRIEADKLVETAMGDHFEVGAWAWQERPKLGSREQLAFGDQPKREWVFLLRRRPV